jgi:cell division control protein 45
MDFALVDDQVQKRKRERIEKRRLLVQNQDIIKDYYSAGTYYGVSASELLYTLASQLGRSTNDMLWWAILGLTEQYIGNKINYIKYVTVVEEFQHEVAKFNIDKEPLEPEPADLVPPGLEEEDEEEVGPRERFFRNPKLASSTSVGLHGTQVFHDHLIKAEEEFRLMMYRHWNLADSMFYSPYVATKLGIWTERGRSLMLNMLAKMG